MNSIKISVAIATYNEQDSIGRCLKSVADWVDEIIVVDGSSDDKTRDIAKEYKARIVKTDNPPIFHINKQKAINEASGKWILQLDADEVVTPELKKEILQVLENEEINGYWIPRKNYFLGKFLTKGGQYPDYTLRLYRNGKGKLPCKNVHEQAVVSGEVGYLKSPMEHYSYPEFTHYLEHFNRYTTLFANELEQENVKLGLMSFILYMFVKPKIWFFKTYIRHKGFMDGFPGFVFCLFSSLRFSTAYIKYWEKVKTGK